VISRFLTGAGATAVALGERRQPRGAVLGRRMGSAPGCAIAGFGRKDLGFIWELWSASLHRCPLTF
jgi:hypothetical protein